MRKRTRGFSLIEVLVVLAIAMVVSAAAVLNVITAIKNSRVNTAYQSTMTSLRQARQGAIDERAVYRVTFTAPRTILTEKISGGATTTVAKIDLPFDIEFRAEPGIPNTNTGTPDQFGTGSNGIDFSTDYGGAGTLIIFNPDGSGSDTAGRVNNGVVYMVRRGDLNTARAVSVFGATGRIKGWKLVQKSGGGKVWIAN